MGGANSTEHFSGRVEVRPASGGSWGTICDDDFDEEEASVICKMLGYPYGINVPNPIAYFGWSDGGPIYMDDLHCVGNETSILDCEYPGWRRSDCGHSEDAGIGCFLDRGNCIDAS